MIDHGIHGGSQRMAGSRHAHLSTFSVFRNRSFSLLWMGQLTSGMGGALTTLAASILVFRVTGKALSVGLMLVATAAPTILVGLLAGVFVDRYDRKRILVASDILRSILILLIPFLASLNIIWLYLMVALSSATTQFFQSAQASVLPELAPDAELSAANSLIIISSQAAMTIGYAVAGLIAVANINLVFYLSAILFALSGLLMWIIHIPTMAAVGNTSLRAIGVNLGGGFQAVRDLPILRSLFTIFIPIFLMMGLQISLWLPFSVKILGGTAFEFGALQSVNAIGIVLGSLLMAGLADRIREGQWLALSFILIALSGVAYSLSPTISIAILLVGLAGFVNAPSFVGQQLVIQRATPRELRGRVNSGFLVLRAVMFTAGMLLAGLGDIVDIRFLYLASSLAMLIAGCLSLIMPGLSQPAREWRRLLSMLRGVEAAPRLGAGMAATVSAIDRFIEYRPELTGMSLKERKHLASETLVAQAPAGKIVVYRGETSNAAYFILKGSVGAGYIKGDEYVILNYLKVGDFFGEVAALTGSARTANVITEEDSEFLIIPAKVMRWLADKYPDLKQVFFTTMAQRLSAAGIPLGTLLDQELLRELRTNAPAVEQ
jgi:CRP-like cAMP-binding protein